MSNATTEPTVSHTPEPWGTLLHNGGYTHQDTVEIVAADGDPIASVGQGRACDRNRMFANARVMKASPALLSVLKELHRYETDGDWREEQESKADEATAGNVTFLEVLLARCEATINDAEGR